MDAQEPRVEEILKVAELMIENGHPSEMLIRHRREVSFFARLLKKFTSLLNLI